MSTQFTPSATTKPHATPTHTKPALQLADKISGQFLLTF